MPNSWDGCEHQTRYIENLAQCLTHNRHGVDVIIDYILISSSIAFMPGLL